MVEARFNGQVIARSDKTIVGEGTHYFSRADVEDEYLRPSPLARRIKNHVAFWGQVQIIETLDVDA